MSPPVAASLVVACSVIAQVQTLPTIWRSIEAKRVFPFILPGIFGMPLGTVLLSRLDTRILKLTVGGLLLFFSTSMLFGRTPAKSTWGGLFADGTIGFGGGVLGGLAGLSGPLPTMWATIRHHQMLDQPLEPLAVALAIAIMALGSAFQASVGIGLALFVVPLLALVDQSFIPGPMLLAGVILVLITAYRERAAIDVPALRGSLVGLVIGTIAGAVALKFTSGPTLGKTFGVLVLLAVFLSVTGYRFTATRRSLMIAGGAAGIMGAMVGIHWPPISLVFQNAEPRVARGMLSAFFSVAYLGAVAALAAFGLFGVPQIVRAAILTPGVVVGLIVAPHIAPYIDAARLRLIILAVAATSALVLLVR